MGRRGDMPSNSFRFNPISRSGVSCAINCSSTVRKAANREYSKCMGHPPTTYDLIAFFDASVIAVDGTIRIKPKPFASHRISQVFTLNSFFGVENSRRLYRRV